MYFEQYFPFYAAYSNPLLYEGERMQEQEFNLMKSYYPQTVQRIQEKVEEECDLLDYEGSRLYDEYPDKYMLYHLSCKIKEDLPFEIQHGIYHVFQNSRSCHVSLFRHMSNDKNGDTHSFRNLHQNIGRFPHLRNTSRR